MQWPDRRRSCWWQGLWKHAVGVSCHRSKLSSIRIWKVFQSNKKFWTSCSIWGWTQEFEWEVALFVSFPEFCYKMFNSNPWRSTNSKTNWKIAQLCEQVRYFLLETDIMFLGRAIGWFSATCWKQVFWEFNWFIDFGTMKWVKFV